jgi:hypothetical protein
MKPAPRKRPTPRGSEHHSTFIAATTTAPPSLPLQPSPLSPPGQSENLQRPLRKKPRWKQATDLFLRNIPSASAWRGKQIQVGLSGVDEYKNVVQAFIGNGDVEKELSHGGLLPENEVFGRAIRYPSLPKSCPAKSELSRASSNFQALVLLSLCVYLDKKGIPAKTTDPIIQLITNAGVDRRLRLLRSADDINDLIAELVDRGWSIYRATELFFISMSMTILFPQD